MKNSKIKTFIIASVLILLAILFRTHWHVGPNIEFVTTASFLAATYLGGAWAIIVPFSSMVISDKIIGNTNIYLFTWSAFIFIGLSDYLFIKKFGRRKLILKQTGMGVMASLFFYLYTNFGVWFLDSFGMYTHDLNGLIKCYFMGLPFFKFNLIGNLALIPFAFVASEIIYDMMSLWQKSLLILKHFLKIP